MTKYKNISRKSKYALLKEYGYTAKEANALRGQGREKFSNLLYNSPRFKKADFKEQIRLNNQIGHILNQTGLQGVILYDNKLSPYKNQRARVNYIIKIIFDNGEITHITLPTERVLSVRMLEREVKEYIRNILEYNEKYKYRYKDVKQIIIEGYRKE